MDSVASGLGRRLGRTWSRLSALAGSGRDAPAILMYHRIATPICDPWGLSVTPNRFREQLTMLKAHRCVMSMDQLADGLEADCVPPLATALTFDDGYLDNFETAKPILEELQIPATMFLPTGVVGSGRSFWWDELARLVLGSRRAACFEIEVAGARLAARWGHQHRVPPDLAKWRTGRRSTDPRRLAYVSLWRALQQLSAEDRDQAMETLHELLNGGDVAFVTEAELPMSGRAARELASPMISLGGHGLTHASLPSLPLAELTEEIVGSRAGIAELNGGVPPSGFAYPPGDWNARAREAVAGAGFRWAVTTRSGKIDRDRFDPFALPRISVANWSGRLLLLRLRAASQRVVSTALRQ